MRCQKWTFSLSKALDCLARLAIQIPATAKADKNSHTLAGSGVEELLSGEMSTETPPLLSESPLSGIAKTNVSARLKVKLVELAPL